MWPFFARLALANGKLATRTERSIRRAKRNETFVFFPSFLPVSLFFSFSFLAFSSFFYPLSFPYDWQVILSCLSLYTLYLIAETGNCICSLSAFLIISSSSSFSLPSSLSSPFIYPKAEFTDLNVVSNSETGATCGLVTYEKGGSKSVRFVLSLPFSLPLSLSISSVYTLGHIAKSLSIFFPFISFLLSSYFSPSLPFLEFPSVSLALTVCPSKYFVRWGHVCHPNTFFMWHFVCDCSTLGLQSYFLSLSLSLSLLWWFGSNYTCSLHPKDGGKSAVLLTFVQFGSKV